LQFLPEFRTDFIFAFIAEELGFLGCLILLGLYASLFFVGFKLLEGTRDRFGELIIVGVLSMLFFQIAINIGMNIGILPITGITLPLLSYGGSSVLTIMISLGLIGSVARFGGHRKDLELFALN
jgi:rod shape determining protein RodA